MKITFTNKDFEKAIKNYIEDSFKSEIQLGQIEWVFHRKAREISGEVEFDVVGPKVTAEPVTESKPEAVAPTEAVVNSLEEEITEEIQIFEETLILSDDLEIPKPTTKLDTSDWGLFDE